MEMEDYGMEKITICRGSFLDEQNRQYDLEYSMLIRSVGGKEFYGVEIVKRDKKGKVEAEQACCIFSQYAEAEAFLHRLCAATALPVELCALCDDFISEMQWLMPAS